MDRTKGQITKIAREANKLAIRTMKEDGIGSGEMDLIHLVRHNPGIFQKEISQQLIMDKGAVARRTANLEQKGYLVRKKNPTDGRSQLLYATEKAESLKTSRAAVESVFYEWLQEGLDPEELAAFTAALEKLYLRSRQESGSGFSHVCKRLASRDRQYERPEDSGFPYVSERLASRSGQYEHPEDNRLPHADRQLDEGEEGGQPSGTES